MEFLPSTLTYDMIPLQSASLQKLRRLLRLLKDKRLYQLIGENFAGSRRYATLVVLANIFLLISAVLKSVSNLIASKRFLRIQRFLKLLQNAIWALIFGSKRARNRNLLSGMIFKNFLPKSRPTIGSSSLKNVESLDIYPSNNDNSIIVNNLYQKYTNNSSEQMQLNEISKDNEKLLSQLSNYSTIFKENYSYIAGVNIFNEVYTSVTYIPDMIEIVNNDISQFLNYDYLAKFEWKSLLNHATLNKIIDKLQVFNSFFLNFFQELAFFGDKKLFSFISDKLTEYSDFNWYISSEFWFFYIVLDIVKRFVNSINGKTLVDFPLLLNFVVQNKSSFLKLITAYHWGWDYNFLNSYQLSILNLVINYDTFITNWSDTYNFILNNI